MTFICYLTDNQCIISQKLANTPQKTLKKRSKKVSETLPKTLQNL